MGNKLRCCIACFLPCGALDVIRIVHLNGHFEEYSRSVSAEEILAANPGHVLSKPCSSSRVDGIAGRILIVSPESELKRGSFYFLIPSSSVPNKKIKKKVVVVEQNKDSEDNLSDKINLSEMRRRRKRSTGRVGVWRPTLRSISEDQN